mmetsp:Transcript_33238/g.50225  ORF Transcript_33238/g.50225 Transcript_33238/m.50225 type:complete len:268 (+) Transcript_33238:76-879(+)|eukprot:CAMPEP_0206460582 /NCGR_PEP_ID=MMETSP0324_2-20121206/24832_1 /ASSEMBLY_ACC=CAM_ASM_000836 /TAXON_ID=2866 /ORGANISM="Crypthecodinium cohnii, Strain Seligo" /LENGTH=267 /DNA_ID=CAMNT_0053932301 /DNA_START=83 /DNA_END=886 /DNA_ORIENTATION=+
MDGVRFGSSFAAGALFGSVLLATILSLVVVGPSPSASNSLSRRLLAIDDLKVNFESNLPNVRWNNSVLPENVVDLRLPLVQNPHYGLHVFALGKNGSLFHKFQTGPVNKSVLPYPETPMSPWHVLTPNASMIWGNDPAVALNQDGHIELFVAWKQDAYDLWQMYQTDPKDPLAWSVPRGPTCICDAVSPTACPWCDNCNQRYDCYKNYWLDHAPFTTNDQQLLLDEKTGKLKLYFRNFDGHIYELSQREPNNSTRWSFDSVSLGIFE